MSEASVTEIWKDVPGYDGRYQVSDQGRVRSVDREVEAANRWGGVNVRRYKGRIIRQRSDGQGRMRVTLGLRGPTPLVHQLVMRAFVGPYPEGCEIAHWDGNASNNRLTNLRYTTRTDNHADKKRHGTQPQGEQSAMAKLIASQVLEIRRRYDAGEGPEKIHKDMALDCNSRHVSRIGLRQRWRHL